MVRNPEAAARITAAVGPIPPRVADLHRVRHTIDPGAVYTVNLGNGQVLSSTGAELLATANALLALVNAQEAGDQLYTSTSGPENAGPITLGGRGETS